MKICNFFNNKIIFFILNFLINRCKRLNLVSLAYLWDADQSILLENMINDGMDSVLIKTCAYGLDDKDLLKSIKDLQPKLEKLKKTNLKTKTRGN